MNRYTDGDITYYHDEQGELHREHGPAYEKIGGIKAWYIHGKKHRLDGPAIKTECGYKEYWIAGQKYTEEEFKIITFSLGINHVR